jgi:hypothetical protein
MGPPVTEEDHDYVPRQQEEPETKRERALRRIREMREQYGIGEDARD